MNDLKAPKFSDKVAVYTTMGIGGINVIFILTLIILFLESRKYAKAKMEERNAAFSSEILFAFTSSRFEIV